MLDTFLATISPMLIMFICMMIGFVLRKRSLLPEDAAAVMSKLESYVFVPALSMSTFMTLSAFLSDFLDGVRSF